MIASCVENVVATYNYGILSILRVLPEKRCRFPLWYDRRGRRGSEWIDDNVGIWQLRRPRSIGCILPQISQNCYRDLKTLDKYYCFPFIIFCGGYHCNQDVTPHVWHESFSLYGCHHPINSLHVEYHNLLSWYSAEMISSYPPRRSTWSTLFLLLLRSRSPHSIPNWLFCPRPRTMVDDDDDDSPLPWKERIVVENRHMEGTDKGREGGSLGLWTRHTQDTNHEPSKTTV